MCRASTPRAPALPPPRASRQLPTRSGAATSALARVMSQYGNRSQVASFAPPVLTAKLGGDTVVLGG